MRINKFFALALAGAVALTSAMSVSVSAAIKSDIANTSVSEDGKQFYIDLIAAGFNAADVNGATVVVSFDADETEGFGGGIIMNSQVGGWAQDDANYSWGNTGKPITSEGADGKYTLTFKVPDKAFVDADFAEKSYAQIFVTQWWGKDMKINDVTINGKSIIPAATEEKKDDTTVTDDKKDDTTVTDDKKDDTTVTDDTKAEPVAQKITVGVTSKKLKAADLAKKAVKFKIGAKAETALTYKSNNKNVTVTKAGKVTVKKGTKKGTYKITVTAAATDAYKTAKKVVKVVVK